MTVSERRLHDSLSMTTTVITQCISRHSPGKMPIRSRVGQDSSMHGFVSLSRRGFAISPSISCVSDEVRASKNDIPNSRRVLSISVSRFRKHTSSFSRYYLDAPEFHILSTISSIYLSASLGFNFQEIYAFHRSDAKNRPLASPGKVPLSSRRVIASMTL